MIVVVTGQPGAGKTALAVDLLANDPQFKGRPKFVMGVPDLKLEHEPAPPVAQWTELRQSPEDESLRLPYFTFPQNSVVLVDEAQRVYRPRSTGSAVPPHVAAFETHRHTGVDFILITQQVGLLDANIRKLIGRHVHIRITPLGRYKYEWLELGDPESASSRAVAARTRYKLPKSVFGLYKSAEAHTAIKATIPGYFYVLGAAAVALVGFAGYGYYRYTQSPITAAGIPDKPPSASSPGRQAAPKSTLAYLEERKPRLEGLLHTAPVYDELTKPTEAPFLAGCFRKGSECRCYTQQGTPYQVTPAICSQFLAGGMFKDWGTRGDQETPRRENQDGVRGGYGQQRENAATAPKQAPVLQTREPSAIALR